MNWRSSARWFAAEFLVVVTGILVALALQAWWQARERRDNERAYLTQLRADLIETERIMKWTDSVTAASDRAGQKLVHAYHTAGVPIGDSLLTWVYQAAYYEDPTPVTATADALVATGDLRLINDDTLRTAISDYLSVARKFTNNQNRYVDLVVESLSSITTMLDFSEAFFAVVPADRLDDMARNRPYFPIPPAPRRARPFPFSAAELYRSRQAYNAFWGANIAKSNLAQGRALMAANAKGLREGVDRELSQ